MADLTNQLQAAAGATPPGPPPGPTEYLAAAYGTSPYFALFSHNAGTLTLAATYTLAAVAGAGLIDWSPDGNYIGVSQNSATGFVLLDHTTPGTVTLAATYAIPTFPRTISFSHDGDYIIVGNNGPTLTLLNHTTPGSVSLAATYTLPDSSRQATFPDVNSDYIAVSNFDTPNFTLLDHTTPGSLSLAATYVVGGFPYSQSNGCSFSPNGNYIAYGNGNNSPYFVLFDHTTPGSVSVAATYSLPGANWNAWTPDNDYIAQGQGNEVKLLNHTTPGTVSVSATYNIAQSITSLSFSPTGDYLAVGRNWFSPNNASVTMLDHTTPGSLSLASTYTLSSSFVGIKISFCPVAV